MWVLELEFRARCRNDAFRVRSLPSTSIDVTHTEQILLDRSSEHTQSWAGSIAVASIFGRSSALFDTAGPRG
jgi:hypothetical protein